MLKRTRHVPKWTQRWTILLPLEKRTKPCPTPNWPERSQRQFLDIIMRNMMFTTVAICCVYPILFTACLSVSQKPNKTSLGPTETVFFTPGDVLRHIDFGESDSCESLRLVHLRQPDLSQKRIKFTLCHFTLEWSRSDSNSGFPSPHAVGCSRCDNIKQIANIVTLCC